MAVITASRLSTRRRCLRQDWFKYHLGWRRDREATPLRFGTAFHLGLELMAKGTDHLDAIDAIAEQYAICPDYMDPYDWDVELETVCELVGSHHLMYDGTLKHVEAEKEFQLALWGSSDIMAGKIDGIVELPDGRLAVHEIKTTSEDISPGAPYWDRLRFDEQITIYLIAARQLGYPVECVLYDVCRKPTIQPRQVPVLDDDGNKIVLDADGERVFNKNGSPRQSGDKSRGWELETKMETAAEFAHRLHLDIMERPEFYYARREVTRLEGDLEDFERELWFQVEFLHHSENTGCWFRNASRQTCGNCEYASPCLSGTHKPTNTDLDSEPPSGFVQGERHPELSTLEGGSQ